MKIARPISNLFSRKNSGGKKMMDQSPLNELAETRFNLYQFVGNDEFTKGRQMHPRVISVNEDGIKVLSASETEIIFEVQWTSIKQFNLKESWTEWEIELKDRRKFFFKGEKSFDLHMATDHILDGLIRNSKSNSYDKEF